MELPRRRRLRAVPLPAIAIFTIALVLLAPAAAAWVLVPAQGQQHRRVLGPVGWQPHHASGCDRDRSVTMSAQGT